MKNYIVYINNNSLFITDSIPEHLEDFQELQLANLNFKTFYKEVKKEAAEHYVIINENPKAVWKSIKKSCEVIKAAGGLVKNENDEYLFIFRNKRWDLPKGKVEKGEKMKQAALREVEEECGVKILQNNEKLCRTYHFYELSGKIVLKKTNWYNMTVKGSPKLIPQKEEGITRAEWLGQGQLQPVLDNTYPLIRDVLQKATLIQL
ncbi:MAG: hydrolase [Pedobacter sp.]|jgi:8-oxo-dGTP pyrophosphatase MutT (NUDIX family)|nr:hydrolase [Pedobacter sp.]